jgi:hypothetical protein
VRLLSLARVQSSGRGLGTVVFLGWRGTVLVLSRWPYTVDRSEDGRVGPADFGAPVEDRELGGGGEDGCAVHEMPLSEAAFGLGADEQRSAVRVEVACAFHLGLCPDVERKHGSAL